MSEIVEPHKFLNPQALTKLTGLHLRSKRVVEGHVAGAHRSPYQGFSVEFSEHREYTPGDDIRHLDWKLFGRTDKYYLKRYEDETNLLCYLVVDVSESMRYQSARAPVSKLHYACSLAATLGWLVLQKQDAVALLTFDEVIRQWLNPSSGAAHLKQILQILETAQPRQKTRLKAVLQEVASRLTRRGIVIVISDYFDDPASIFAGLRSIKQRHHDVIALQVMDRAEIDFPFQSPTRFHGLEQNPTEIVDPLSLGKAYRKTIQDFLRSMRLGCADLAIEYSLCRTDEDLGTRLASFLNSRQASVRK